MKHIHETSYRSHLHDSDEIKNITYSVLSISDTRTIETDKSGDTIIELMENEFNLVSRNIVKDDPDSIKTQVKKMVKSTDFLIISGGTGISRRDNTVDTVKKIIDREISGFGELFRFLSYKEIGSSAYISSAFAGLINNTVVFVIPGSTNACRLAVTKLIMPQLKHLAYELRKH